MNIHSKRASLALALTLILSSLLTVSSSSAAAIPAWPSSVLSSETNVYDTNGAVSNDSALVYEVGNSGANDTGLDYVQFQLDNFNTGFVDQVSGALNISAADSPFVFSQSGKVETVFDFDDGRLLSWEIVSPRSNVWLVKFFLDDGFNQPFKGKIDITVRSEELTSMATSQQKSLHISGIASNSIVYGLSQAWPSRIIPARSNPAGSASAPKYSGPEFSSFGAPVLAGTELVVTGKRLEGITSLKVSGALATYKVNSSSELVINVPEDLAPGRYDVEIESSHGKLTHLGAFTVKTPVPTKTLEFKAFGPTLGHEELLKLTNMAKQIGPEYTAIRCIVNTSDPQLAQRLLTRSCNFVGSIRLRDKDLTSEAKSTYTGNGFWFKLVATG
jgi:hypothetical protein